MGLFQKATLEGVKLRMGLVGPSGCGKTWTSLVVGTGIGNRVALIDSERKSARKYSPFFNFDVAELVDKQSPQEYIRYIREAENDYDTIIVDSLTHAWIGTEGALEQADKAGARLKNSFAAWREVTPIHNKLVDAILNCKCHVICTLRVKTEYVLERDDRGKTVPKKVGMAPVMRDGIEYEFDIVADMDQDHRIIVTKTRCHELDQFVDTKPNEKLVKPIRLWLGLDTASDKPARAKPTPAKETPPEEKKAETSPAATGKASADDTGNNAVSDTFGDITKCTPPIADIWKRVPPYLRALRKDWTPEEFDKAELYCRFEICMANEVHKMEEIPDTSVEATLEFVKKELRTLLVKNGHLTSRAKG